jgi:hypothetical protein
MDFEMTMIPQEDYFRSKYVSSLWRDGVVVLSEEFDFERGCWVLKWMEKGFVGVR